MEYNSDLSLENKCKKVQETIALGEKTIRSLSPQVMKSCQKFSQSSNLNGNFILHHYNYKLNHEYLSERQNDQNCLNLYIPKERKRWNRPPLIEQPSIDEPKAYIKSMTKLQSTHSDNQYKELQKQQSTDGSETITTTEDKSIQGSPQNLQIEGGIERKTSPTSSVASYKLLEWDSGADVGYLCESGNQQKPNSSDQFKNFSTIERMALRGCSTALRLDPEGTTEQPQQSLVTVPMVLGRPDANSTAFISSVSGSESEIEITPIVKSHPTSIIESDEHVSIEGQKDTKSAKETSETPKYCNTYKLPYTLKYDLENLKSKAKVLPSTVTTSTSKYCSNSDTTERLPLKKSSSMNLLTSSAAKLPLKRSQSERNLYGKEKVVPRHIFNSTSSIATVVNNKPSTCNKLIQTSIRTFKQESVGVQVSVLKEEEKPPLPKRGTSLNSGTLNSILKNGKSTCKIQNPKISSIKDKSIEKEKGHNHKQHSSSSSSHNVSLMLQADNENITGRTNSFENFSGHIYENVPNDSTSHVSSVDTGCSNSTMPNTSSSIDEKLWGNSDNLVRDIERSVNILKNLVDANKLDKHVKKRLIHHVIKRLVSARYTDDKIEHNLEENVPWNPADARNKVYRTEIIQALAKNTTESSEDWKPLQKKKNPKKSTSANEARNIKDIINIPAGIESSNSDKFDRNTDRTVMDGRKARMGLRVDDCDRHSSSNIPTNKSESSECFSPQRGYKKNKVKDMFVTSTSNSSRQDQNRALLDAVVNSRRSPLDSSNEVGNSADWRIPTTVSERMYELQRRSNSDSGDTKLVSYAEMEKRNQLIWITNEISHLSNLKKLLEQPKIKSDRLIQTSPRKNKHKQQQSISKQQKLPASSYNYEIQNSNVTVTDDNLLSKQWSSHCNLANCSPMDTNVIRHLKKRNSCTQTASDHSSAYSRTGSEVVSARIHSPNTKLMNVYVQTPKRPTSTNSTSSVSKLHANCMIHQTVPLNCTCRERVCLFCKSRHLSQHRLFTDDKQGVHNKAKFVCNDVEKETKNQINKIKLKCTCELNDNYKGSDSPDVDKSKKSTISSQTCNHQYCEGSICLCRKYKLSEAPSGESSRGCECGDNNLVCEFEKMNVNKSIKKKIFDKATGKGCNCDCKKVLEVQNKRLEYSHYSNKQVQAHYFDSSKESNNSQDHWYSNKSKDRGKIYPSPNHNARTIINSTFNEYKCCRICGMVYHNDRKCGCAVKSYPKPVAYELSFGDENKISGSTCYDKGNLGVKNIEKKNTVVNDIIHEEKTTGCVCGGLQHKIQRCECNHEKEQGYKCNNEKKTTLQDYLVTNNPGFAENVETRRQYVSEIQRLRQLRKDRRVQLLSMATTSTKIVTSPRPTKVTKCVQKKISNDDMRARLRKRYFQLSEVRMKRKQQQLQQEARCNKLMAKIFCKKLQQKVLRGQVDLSQSVSVISNL